MFQQLTQLSLDADGRYATDAELQFLETYLESVPVRLSAYEKLRDATDELLDQVESRIQRENYQILRNEVRDMTSVWRRDVKITLRHAAAAMLMNDLERFKDCFLLWQRTIIQAFKTDHIAKATYADMQKLLDKFFTPEELAYILPLIQLSETVLG